MLNKIYHKVRAVLGITKKDRSQIEILPDDIFIVSYPKSGNTWMRFLIGNYINKDSIDFLKLNKFVPDIYNHSAGCAKIEFRPRFIKSHSPYTPSYPRVVYIIRDGRDVAVSYYYYLQKLEKISSEQGFSEFFKEYVKGIQGFGTWSDHVESWMREMKKNNMLVIKYEDMLEDAGRELEKVVGFAGLEIDSERISKAVEDSSLQAMQKLEDEQHESFFVPRGATNKEVRFVRKGEAGQWRNYFNEADENCFLSLNGDTLRKVGYV